MATVEAAERTGRRVQAAFWPLAGVLLAGWALLCFQLGQRSLWIDEYVTIKMITGTPAAVVAAAARDIHPPLYFLALRQWTQAAGSSDLALRWPSAAAALVAAALAARLARRLAGRPAVVAAVALLVFNPALIAFGRMARYYSLTAALGVLSTLLLLRALRRGGRSPWLAYAIATLALVYTAYVAALLVAAQALCVASAATGRRGWRGFGMALAAISALYLPWVLVWLPPQVARAGTFGTADLARSPLGLALGVAAGAYTFSAGETLFPWRPEAWLALGAVLGLVGAGLRRCTAPVAALLAMAALVVAGVALVTTFVAAGTPFLNVPARALFALPFVALAAALGWAGLAGTRWRWLAAAALTLGWGASLFSLYTAQQFLNPIYYTPAREAAALVAARAAPGDLVVSDPDSVFDRYFLPAAGGRAHLYTSEAAAISAALAGQAPPRVWLVTIGRDRTRVDNPADLARAALAAGYILAGTQGLLPLDPLYNRLKARLLRRPVYDYRLTIEIYERAQP